MDRVMFSDTSFNTNATENDVNQLTDIYVFDIDNNEMTDANEDYVFYSEDSLVTSTASIPPAKQLKSILKQDSSMHNYLDNSFQVNHILFYIKKGTFNVLHPFFDRSYYRSPSD